MHSLDQLTAFLAVYETHSYSAAGRVLQKDRTTIRELVKAYEDSLGYGLFSIQGRKATPTHQAERLVSQVKLVLRQNEKLVQFSDAIFNYDTVQINISYDGDVPTAFISELESRALNSYPELRINWYEKERNYALKQLIDNETDLAILPAKWTVTPEYPLKYKHLGCIDYGVYVGSQSPLIDKPAFTIEDAQLEIQYVSEHAKISQGTIQDFSSHFRVVSSNNLMLTLLETRGWALIPVHIASDWVETGKLIKLHSDLLANDLKVPFSLFQRLGSQDNQILNQITQWCDEMAGTYFT